MKKHIPKIIGLVLVSWFFLLSNSSNPPNGNTGAPGDGVCSNCHNGGSFTGDISLSGLPATVNPNTTYPLTVIVNNTNGGAARSGFQLVALDNSNNNAGSITGNADVDATPSGGRIYAEHDPAKNFAGGTTSYSFDWTSPASGDVNFYMAGVIGNGAGTNGDNGVVNVVSATVTAIAPLAASIASSTDNICNGGSSGSAQVSVSGGIAPYSYSWSNGGNTNTITGLPAGLYTCTVSDSNGSSTSVSVTITEPSAIISSITGTNILCFGDNNGTATVSASGGTGTLSYSWNTGDVGNSINGLSPGTYNVTITDMNGCTDFETVTISQPMALSLSPSSSPVTCNGNADGAVSVMASGGTSGYSYLWSNGSASASQTGLSAGTYSVTVTDANGCTEIASTTVTQPSSLVASVSTNNVSCNGGSDGQLTVSVTGGTSGYSYLWSNGSAMPTISGLAAGAYSVTITDVNGCMIAQSATVAQPTAVTASISTTDEMSVGANDGTATVSVSGGTPGYTYSWSNGATTATISNLAPATYSVTITDSNGCTQVVSGSVGAFGCTLSFSTPSIMDVSCNGGSDGSATISGASGTTPYSYAWSNGATSATVTGMSAGTYTFTVTDGSGCVSVGTLDVFQPSAIMASSSANDVNCNGNSDGTVNVTASGGTPPYDYVWSNGVSGAGMSSQVGLAAGTYSVTLTDANGCVETLSESVGEPSAINITLDNITNETDTNGNGMIEVSVSGGTPSYTFQWFDASGVNVSTNEDAVGLVAGDYYLVVTDANGCTITSISYTVNMSVNIEDLNLIGMIDVFPNPVRSNLHVLNHSDESGQIFISDISGRTVLLDDLTLGNNSFDVSLLSKGIYILKTQIGKSSRIDKIVIE